VNLNLICACPSKGQVTEWLQDQCLNLFLACAMSQHKPDGSLVLPTSARHAVKWSGLTRCRMTDVAQSRNKILFAALYGHLRAQEKTGRTMQPADWMLTYDSDNFHLAGEDITRMVIEGERKGAAAIGAPVSRRDGFCNFQVDMRAHVRRADFGDYAGRLLQVERLGAAFMAVNLNWIRRHWPKPPWFAFVEGCDENGEPTWTSEDFYFCDGLHERGGELWLDARFEPRHDGVEYHDSVPGRHMPQPLRYRVPEESDERDRRDPASDRPDDEQLGVLDLDPMRGIKDRLGDAEPVQTAG